MSIKWSPIFAVVACFVIATAYFTPDSRAAMDPNSPPGGDDPPPLPTTIEEIETCLNNAVSDGTVEGNGYHPILQFINLWQMKYALEQARLAYGDLKLEEAYGWLAYAYLRCDGPAKPLGDWVNGSTVPEVKKKILDVMSQIAPLL